MGSQFYFIFDIAVIAILLSAIYIGSRRGFISVLAGLVAGVFSLIVAIPLSGTISDFVYERIIEQKLQDTIDENFSEIFSDNIITQLKNVDTSKIVVNSKPLSELDTSTDSLNNINLKLDSVDMTNTGIDKQDFKSLGFDSDTDYSNIKVGQVIIKPEDLAQYKLGDIVFSYVIAAKIRNTVGFGTILTSTEKIADTIPELFGSKANDVKNGNIDAISDLILNIIKSEKDLSDSVLDSLVKPFVLTPIKMIIFLVLFGILSLILKLIVNKLSIINDIPIIGSVNAFLGAVVGIIQGIIIVFIIAIIIKAITIMSDNSIILLNQTTLDKTFLFRYFYNFNIMDFLNN